jgi:hypothetical protein
MPAARRRGGAPPQAVEAQGFRGSRLARLGHASPRIGRREPSAWAGDDATEGLLKAMSRQAEFA